VPIVRIDIQTGKSTAYKRDILRSVRAAITRSLDVADERVTQRIVETPAENIDAPDERSDRLTVIDISMLPGRDATLKQSMYAAIVAELGDRPGIHQHDVTVLVNDPAAECFAIGGVMQCTLPGQAELPGVSAEELAEDEPVAEVAEGEPVEEVAEPQEVTSEQAPPEPVLAEEPLSAEPSAAIDPASGEPPEHVGEAQPVAAETESVVEWPTDAQPEA